ncbi:hypothetical protein [Teichococcus aestuarii]|uniref:hypothetical protein n=1 Tax=Teichococcus aestuarii TaxID=568898 RepID=UPI0011B27D91|nr:hypothetical protein [Pseudoroseomonas aestuarii]
MTDPILARIQAARTEGPRRSPLANWLLRHREAFARILREGGVNWERFGAVFVEEGLLPRPEHFDAPGPEGHKARRRVAETARKAWARAQLERGAMAARPSPEPVAAPPAPVALPTAHPAGESSSKAQDRLARLKRQTLDRSGRKA